VLAHIRKRIKQERISLLIIDPLVELHRVNEIDNGQMAEVWGEMRKLAQAGCAVIVIAHCGKPDKADSTSHIGNLNALRGASSQGNVIRKAETLFTPPKGDEKDWKFEHPRETYVRMDCAKNNLGPRRLEPRWFHKIGVPIANGEVVGVLQPATLQQNVTIKTDGLPGLERVLAGCLQTGTWQSFNSIKEHLTPAEQGIFGDDAKNRSRIFGEMFDGRDEVLVEGGKITRQNKKGNIGWQFRFDPHTPQNDAEEQTRH
jgi:hypothetical protein